MTKSGNALALAMLLAMPLAVASTAAAQSTPLRSGFGFSMGLGVGEANVTCDGCPEFEALRGISGYARLGGYASPSVFLGVEGNGWIKNSDGFERRIAAASVVVLAYAGERNGLFLKGGGGFIRAVIQSGPDYAVGEGITWQVGLGWDLPGSAPLSFTPYVNYIGSTEVALSINDLSTGGNLNPNILQVGLAITVH
jgi:hypothetical protein